MDGVNETVVVDQRNEKHEDDADREKADLLVVESVELGVERGGLDLKHRDERQQKDEAEKNPIEVAVRGEAGHACC
jgi:hypothetical protein